MISLIWVYSEKNEMRLILIQILLYSSNHYEYAIAYWMILFFKIAFNVIATSLLMI